MANFSRQRESILKDLQSRYDHPTADMVYDSVRSKLPNISLGTVYRNLSLLTESGQILKITTGIGPDRFDGHIEEHHHFVCNRCGAVMDLDFMPRESILKNAQAHFPGRLEGYHLQFFGQCEACAKAQIS